MKKTAKFLAVLLAVLMMASTFTAFAQTDVSGEKYNYYTDLKFDAFGGARVNEGVTVFEFKLPKYTGSIDGETYAAFSLLQNCGGTDYVLDLISVEAATGNILVGSEGKYYALCTSTGEAMMLQDTPVAVAVVYDDTNGTARYFVNGSLGYVKVGDEIFSTASLKVYDTDFYGRDFVQTTSFRLFKDGGAGEALEVSAYEFSAYNINKGDTARIIGFQENGLTDQIRVLAGIDTLYYNQIGFEIEPFIGGVSKGVSEITENIVFSSVSADDKTLTAESVGHRYLAAAEITSLPRPILDNSYLSIRAFTEIDGERYYDEAIKIVVNTDANNDLKYFFDKDGFIYTNTFDGIDAIPSEWKFTSSETGAGVSFADGKLQLSETVHGGGAFLYLDQYVGMNTLVQADVTITYKKADNAYLGMLFGYQNTGNFDYMWIRYNGEGGFDEKRNNGSGIAFPGSSINASKTGFSFELNKTYTITLICQGEKASFFVDGVLISEGELEGSVRKATGKVGFIAKGMTYNIDNVIVRTTDDIVENDVLYSSDFEDAQTASSEWIEMTPAGVEKTAEESSALSLEDGKLKFSNPTNAWTSIILNKDFVTGDYIVQGDVKINSQLANDSYLGLVFRHSSSKKFIDAALRMRGDGWIEAQASGSWSPLTGLGNDKTPVFKLSTDEEEYIFTLTAVCKGETISFYVNGTLIGSGTFDGVPANKTQLDADYLAGKVGFYAKGITMEIDNFVVKELDNTYSDYIVYEENFDSYAALPNGWKTTTTQAHAISTVGVTDGKLKIVEPKGVWFITYLDREFGLENYEYSAKITINEYEKGNAARYLGLVFNYKDVNNFAKASFRINGEGSMGLMRLNGSDAGDGVSFNLKNDIGITPAIGKTYTLKVKVVNDVATFYVDDKELGSYSLNGRLAAGKVGIIASGVSISVDDVLVSKFVAAPYYDIYHDLAKSDSNYTSEWSSNVSGAITYSNGKMVVIDSKTNTYINPHINIKDANGKYLGYNAETGTNDYEVETKITPSSYTTTSGAWNPYWGLALRYQDPTHYIELCVGKTGGMYIEMSNESSGATGKLAIDNFTHGRTYTLKARCVGQELTVYVDGVEVAKATIPTSLNTGTVGFTARNYNYTVDNFKVTSVDGSNTVLYNTGFGDVISDDWTMVGLSDKNKVTRSDNGGVYFDINELSYVRGYLNKDFGYNESTKTNDYIIEAEYTIEDWIVSDSGQPNIGFYFRQGPDLDNDGNYEEHKDYVYAAIRPNTGYGWIQGNNTSGSGLYNNASQANATVALNKGSTYILKATVIGDSMDFVVTEKATNRVALHVYVTNPLDGKFDTGMVGFGNYGVKGTLESFVVKPIIEEGKTPEELGFSLAPEKVFLDSFSTSAALPTEWYDEVGARRNGVTAKLSIGTSAKTNTNGSLIVDARGSVHNVIALDKTVEGGFIYELDLTMLRQDNIADVSYKMGPVFGLQDDSVSVGVDSRVGAIGNTSSQKTDVEAWLLKNANSYYPGVDSSWHNFGSFTLVNATGTTYRYKIVGADGYASIYVDGKLMLTCAIDDPFLDGRFGIMLRNAAVSIDNVKIQKYLKKYEIPADPDAEPSVVLRIATFNIGDFSTASGTADIGISKGNGTDVTKQEYIDALNSVGASIWAFQEDSQYFNGNTKESPYDAIYSKVLPNHQRNFTGGYNGKAFLSGYELYDVQAINYSKVYDAEVYPNGTTDYGHPWFLTGKVMINDIEVTLVTLHFDWQCKVRRAQQIADILDHVKGLDYVIVLGDVNPDNKVNEENLGGYVNDRDNQYFIDQGYTVANGGEFGLFYTTMTKGAPRNTDNPCDNIYTSSKITMLNAEPVYMSWMSDHAIVIADIEIK